jgi:peptide/nickel transport system substrate-binding protein
LYGDISKSARIIRQAIYDGPIDEVDFQQNTAILENIPSQENGLVNMTQVEVLPGERMVDAKGNRTYLASGIVFRPSGCSSRDCWEVYENQPSITLDQVVITFQIKSGLNWSDGAPLVPEDSIFSYQIAQEIYGQSGPRSLRFTQSYELSEDDVIWSGLPGYLGIYSYADHFFTPLPSHQLSRYTVEELFTSSSTTQKPIGWGPYKIIEWIQGDHITLVKNDSYHLYDLGLPTYDSLVFRFVEGGEEALAAYSAGECAIVLNEPGLFDYLDEIQIMEEDDLVNLIYVDLPTWEQISFGINSLDDSKVLLDDPEIRKAIAYCINRDEIKSNRVDAGTMTANLYHPLDYRHDPEVPDLNFQPVEANSILEDMGWKDDDQDPSTPRIAIGVKNVPYTTPLSLTLLESGSDESSLTASMIKDQLSDCGIEISIEVLPPGEMFAAGPEGPIFGRKFDLALFAWSVDHYHLCRIFLTDEIPGQYPQFSKGWGGTNATGFSDDEFDQACVTLSTSLPDSEQTLEVISQVQQTFQKNLPAMALFFRRDIILANPDIEELVSGRYEPLWNLEDFR